MTRFATEVDHSAVTETIALAFNQDPVWSWAFPEEDCSAAAIWIAPGRPELSPEYERRLEPLLEELMGPGAARVSDSFERFEAAHPHEPEHFYLSLLGTHPEHRRRGIGMELLAESLDLIDAEGAPAFLESSNPANDQRYERLGFVRCGEFELPEDGPNVTQMWRDPR